MNTYPKLVHHVFFWLKDPGSREDLAKLLAGLRTLANSASEILFFDDTAGQEIYQDHPIHEQFVADCSHLWQRVVVYDVIAA